MLYLSEAVKFRARATIYFFTEWTRQVLINGYMGLGLQLCYIKGRPNMSLPRRHSLNSTFVSTLRSSAIAPTLMSARS